MEFKTIPCHPDLQPFIRNYWLLTARCTAPGTQRIFSNGAASMHFYLTQECRLDGDDGIFRTAFNRHDLSSMKIYTNTGMFNVLGIEFVPFCAHLFFPHISVSHASPEDMKDQELKALEEQIVASTEIEEQKMLLDEFFCKRLESIPIDDLNMDRLTTVFKDIVPIEGDPTAIRDYESLSSGDLASAACLGQKQFTRVFNKYVGLSPKTYLRLLRFNKAMLELQKSAQESSLTEIAWQCGYYDLAHMTNDFTQLCGYSPKKIIEMGTHLTEAFQKEFSSQMKKKVLLENVE